MLVSSEFMGKTFQAAQLTNERFLTLDHSLQNIFLISAQLKFQSGQKVKKSAQIGLSK